MMTTELFSRERWIDSCNFHDLSEGQIFEKLFDRIQGHIQGRAKPVVLLDLDSTLYEVGPRTFQILSEWARTFAKEFPGPTDRMMQMAPTEVAYSVVETFEYLKIDHTDALRSAQRFWFERFFTNEYLKYDLPYSGSAQFTKNVLQTGAEIVYLTGRDRPGMGIGTEANLIRDGFAWGGPRTRLLMKPDFHTPDLDFKKAATEEVRGVGSLIASFENEPPNVVALFQLFPDAMHVFVDTVCSHQGALACRGLYRIKGWEATSSSMPRSH